MFSDAVEQPTETELVVTALLGDLEAFDRLVRSYRGAVFSVARQFTETDEDAEDIAQEALLLVFKALPQLEHPDRFGGWLFAITRNYAMRHNLRSNRFESKPVSDIDALILKYSPSVAFRPSEVFERGEIRRAVRAMVTNHREYRPERKSHRGAPRRRPTGYQAIQRCPAATVGSRTTSSRPVSTA